MPKSNSTPAPAPEQETPATTKVVKVRTPEEKRASALKAVATRREQPGGLSVSAQKAIATRQEGKGPSGRNLSQSAQRAWAGANGVKRRASLAAAKVRRAAEREAAKVAEAKAAAAQPRQAKSA